MKKIYNSPKVLIVFFLLFNIVSLEAKEEYTKVVQKDYSTNSNTSLVIVNKYGTVKLMDWDKPQISITVKITVDHNNKNEAEKLLDMIHIDFSDANNVIKAVTNIDEGFGTSGIWSGLKGGKNFSIDYNINLPRNLSHVTLNNKYGNIVVNELSGLLEIDLKYGNLNINKLTRSDDKPLNTIILGYGKANIDQCSWLKFNLSYSQAAFSSCKALIVVSKYSKIAIDKSSSIVAESAYDGYSLGDLNNFVVTGKYSNYSLSSLTTKLDADIKYSDINVNSVPKNFESIKITNSYGKINLGIASDASYSLDAFVKYAGINYPETGRVSRISENTSTTVKGVVGTDKNTSSSVNINSSYGGVNLRK